jgi:recombination protein RecT
MALPAHISPDKFQRTVMTAVAAEPGPAEGDRRASCSPATRPPRTACCPMVAKPRWSRSRTRKKVDGQWQKMKVAAYMPMVYGLRKKILQSGEVVALEVGVVYARRSRPGTSTTRSANTRRSATARCSTSPPRTRPTTKIVGAYSIATMKDGTKSYEFMRRFEIDKVRECEPDRRESSRPCRRPRTCPR